MIGLTGLLLAVSAAVPGEPRGLSLDGDGWRLDYRLEEEGGAWKSVPATVWRNAK